jgi:exodeoxyribonuclease VII small subunit
MTQASPTISFEQALKQLQSIVERLERSDLDLATAIASFEQGVQLSRQCGQLLQEAEQRVEMLSRSSDGSVSFTPMASQDEPEEAEE